MAGFLAQMQHFLPGGAGVQWASFQTQESGLQGLRRSLHKGISKTHDQNPDLQPWSLLGAATALKYTGQVTQRWKDERKQETVG